MVTVRPISLEEYMPAMSAMFEANWQEMESHLSESSPAPDVVRYFDLERAGCIVALGAFAGDQLVGYLVAVLMYHPHYGFPMAEHDLLYVQPRHRSSSAYMRLMAAARDALRKAQAECVFWHAKPGSAFNTIMSHSDAPVEEIVYRETL